MRVLLHFVVRPDLLCLLPKNTEAEEAVMFISAVKHGRHKMSLPEVHDLLKDVGLTDSDLYSRPIGGTLAGGLQIRGCSGGEKKRLALACALAMKPKLILLDELTSGLDSSSANTIMQLLKNLCVTRGIAAAVIIHQPDGYTFRYFDRLVLNFVGKCVFSDDVSRLPDLYRNCYGCDMPSSIHELPYDLLHRLQTLPEDMVLAKPPADIVKTVPGAAIPKEMTADVSFTAEAATHFGKLVTVFKRNLINHYVRNVTNLVARLVIYSACSLIDGAIFWQVGRDQPPSVIIGPITFVLLISYLLPFGTIPLIVHEKKFFLFERSLGLYSPWIYCICQALLEAWVVILASLVEACIVIPMCGLWNTDIPKWESFFTLLGAFIASGLTGSCIVLFCSILFPSQDLAFLMAAGIVVRTKG